MKTIAICNYKGGVGKTATAINFAAELAALGKKIIVIDADGQRNLSKFFRADTEDGNTTYELLTGDAEICWADVVQDTAISGVQIVPASAELPKADLAALTGGKINHNGLRDFCLAAAEDGEVDFVLIDCPTSYSAATVAALGAADEVLIPTELEGFALDGARDLCEQVDGIAAINPRLRVAGALITKRKPSRLQNEAEKTLRASGVPTFETVIPSRIAVPESTIARKTLREYCPNNPAQTAYRDFALEYLKKNGGNGNGEEKI